MGFKPRSAAGGVRRDLQRLATPERAAKARRYFQAQPGGYGEGDRFYGVAVPDTRAVARKHRDLPLATVEALLCDPVHEVRLCALFILVAQFRRSRGEERQTRVDLYLRNLDRVNGWDLVDSSAHLILGAWLKDGDRALLHQLAKTDHLWRQRVAMIATLAFIRDGDFGETLALAEVLLHHQHDLIHKAVGWMLREVGNRDRETLETFLGPRYGSMPRTMLRYAIEKLPEERRQRYLEGAI